MQNPQIPLEAWEELEKFAGFPAFVITQDHQQQLAAAAKRVQDHLGELAKRLALQLDSVGMRIAEPPEVSSDG